MLVGQLQNDTNEPIYGRYVVRRHWFFMVLQEKSYAISRAYSSDNDSIYDIIKILKALRNLLFEQIQPTPSIGKVK